MEENNRQRSVTKEWSPRDLAPCSLNQVMAGVVQHLTETGDPQNSATTRRMPWQTRTPTMNPIRTRKIVRRASSRQTAPVGLWLLPKSPMKVRVSSNPRPPVSPANTAFGPTSSGYVVSFYRQAASSATPSTYAAPRCDVPSQSSGDTNAVPTARTPKQGQTVDDDFPPLRESLALGTGRSCSLTIAFVWHQRFQRRSPRRPRTPARVHDAQWWPNTSRRRPHHHARALRGSGRRRRRSKTRNRCESIAGEETSQACKRAALGTQLCLFAVCKTLHQLDAKLALDTRGCFMLPPMPDHPLVPGHPHREKPSLSAAAITEREL